MQRSNDMMNNAALSSDMIIDDVSPPNAITVTPADSVAVIARWMQSWSERVRQDARALSRSTASFSTASVVLPRDHS